MLPVPVYYALLLLCWGYALLRGGAPERIAATIVLVGSLLTLAAVSNLAGSYASVETGVFLVDAATLVAFLILALRAERFWPIWLTALQLLGTTGHAIKLVDPDIIPRAYAFAAIFWSYLMLPLLALGTWRHQRRVALYGADKSWSTFSARSGRGPPGGPIA
jgi:hypothetical protein